MTPFNRPHTSSYSLSFLQLCIVSETKARYWSKISIFILTRDIDIAILSIRPSVRVSVRPSVTFRHSMETA